MEEVLKLITEIFWNYYDLEVRGGGINKAQRWKNEGRFVTGINWVL